MNIENAQYIEGLTGEISSVKATIDGVLMSIPLILSNRHYAEIMRQVEEEDLVIQEPESTE